MPKSRSTIPIVHADDVPTIALTDEEWQAIEHAFGRQLNADVRQQITTVTAQYCKDCVFEPAAPKEMALKRIERLRRPAGDLEKLIFDREVFSASPDALSRRQQNSAHSYADGLIRRHLLRHDGVGFHSTAQMDLFCDELEVGAGLLLEVERSSRARDKLDHFRDMLKSWVFACDCALNDLSAAEYCDDDPWNWWIEELTRIAQRHCLPYGSRIVETSGEPSPFAALVRALQLTRALQEHVPPRHMFSDEALAKAVQRAQGPARDK